MIWSRTILISKGLCIFLTMVRNLILEKAMKVQSSRIR